LIAASDSSIRTSGKAIGAIDVYNRFTLVDVPSEYVRPVVIKELVRHVFAAGSKYPVGCAVIDQVLRRTKSKNVKAKSSIPSVKIKYA